MDMNVLGRSGVQVSAIGLGTMNFGSDWHGIGAVDEKTARELLAIALDFGVNLIDTADVYGYGASESMLGRIMGRRRSKLILATKVFGQMRPGDPDSGGLSRRHITQALNASLKRLRTDYIDLYMPHAWDPAVPLEETLEALDDALVKGKVRVLGCSNFSGEQLQQALSVSAKNRWARFEFDEVQYSLASRFIEGDVVAPCIAGDLSVLAWSPLGGGFLTGKYSRGPRPQDGRRWDPETAFPMLPEKRLDGLSRVVEKVALLERIPQAQTAIGWLLSKPYVASVLVGARTPEQLMVSLAPKVLSRRSIEFLDKASAISLAA